MSSCGSYYDWTEECRQAGCKKCGELVFEKLPPAECACEKETRGYITVARRVESCPVHGRCRCVSGPTRYDDHRESYYTSRKWHPNCPIVAHRKDSYGSGAEK